MCNVVAAVIVAFSRIWGVEQGVYAVCPIHTFVV